MIKLEWCTKLKGLSSEPSIQTLQLMKGNRFFLKRFFKNNQIHKNTYDVQFKNENFFKFQMHRMLPLLCMKNLKHKSTIQTMFQNAKSS